MLLPMSLQTTSSSLDADDGETNVLEHFHAMLSHVWMGEVARAFLGRRSRERRTYRLGSLSDASGITENALEINMCAEPEA